MNTQLGKWGNSLALRIPQVFAKELDLSEGAEVEVTCVGDALLVRSKKVAYSLDELLAQIKPEQIHGETDWGPTRGREAW